MKKFSLMLAVSVVVIFTFSLNLFASALPVDKASMFENISKPTDGRMYKEPVVAKPAQSKFITRGEYLAMLHDALDLNIRYFAAPNIESIYSDMRNSDKYAGQMYDLHTIGILEGQGKLWARSTVKEEEALYYLMKAYKYGLDNGTFQGKWDWDEDVVYDKIKGVGQRYEKNVERAQYIGFFEVNAKSFRPKGLLTREKAQVYIQWLEKRKMKNAALQALTVKPKAKLAPEGIEMSVEFTNNTSNSLVVEHSYGTLCEFTLLDENKRVIYDSAEGKISIMMMESTTFGENETKSFKKVLKSSEYKELVDKVRFFKPEISGWVNGERLGSPEVVVVEKMDK